MTDLRVRAVGAALVCVGALIAVPQPAYAAAGDNLPFASAVFRATHNSYSGGSRGSITAQLDSGVRFVEFDVWSGDHAATGDFRIGHSSAGDQVDHTGGNPADDKLRSWLTTVSGWSAGHPAAAPITVMFDLKDDPGGDLGALNQEIGDVFGTRLVRGLDTPGALPAIGALRGRVVPLLSGNATARTSYKRDTGANPAVAINPSGQVVEVHDNGSGSLWYWSGSYGPDGRVTWLRHGKYDTGKAPAVALTADGAVVEVHQAGSGSALWSRVGHLDTAGEITWGASAKFDTGVRPSVTVTGNQVREIHQSQSNAQNWDWQGTVTGTTITWGAHGKTGDARFPTATSAAAGRTVDVLASSGTLTVTTDRASAARIRFPQVAFVEYQPGDSAELKDGSLFWAATASNKSFIVSARQAGVSARGWDFDSASLATDPIANYPATNNPNAAWYLSMLNRPDVVS